MRVLILGATGMLGYSLYANLTDSPEYEVFASVRSLKGCEQYFEALRESLHIGLDVTSINSVESLIAKIEPDVVINCIGLIKQYDISKQHLAAVSINSLLPHQLASICDRQAARLIHFSTDCVFSGASGGYTEESKPDASDLYGRSKHLGEVGYGNHLTLRTSIIGHELKSKVSLVSWFLGQEGMVNGYKKAFFSGLPTSYIAKLLVEVLLPQKNLSGMYHLSAESIDKFSLLSLVAETYGKTIEIIPNEEFEIDRSLDSEKLRSEIGVTIPGWPELISHMHNDYLARYLND